MADAKTINFRWIVRLRWGVSVSLAAMILAGRYGLELPLPLLPLLSIVGLALVSNALCAAWGRGNPGFARAAGPALLWADVLILTATLHLSGGSQNPFSFLYLIYIVLGAVVMRSAATWSLVALSMLGYGSLFVWHYPLYANAGHAGHSGNMMKRHLEGMWISLGVTSIFVVYFVQRLNRALARREAELLEVRERSERVERLASLATLAAGAAHELATPLSTIAVAAGELQRQLGESDAVEDVALIREQVKRCRAVLDQMSVDAGESGGEGFSQFSLADLLDDLLQSVGDASERIEIERDDRNGDQAALRGPRRALGSALSAVVQNALDVSDRPVLLSASHQSGRCELRVLDHGPGLSEAALAHATEPFFTTKEPGHGMGLGLFLARATLERIGGELSIESKAGEGAEVTLRFGKRDAARGEEER